MLWLWRLPQPADRLPSAWPRLCGLVGGVGSLISLRYWMTPVRQPSLPAMQAADFHQAMRSRPVARSVHFLLHFLPTQNGLSTDHPQESPKVVNPWGNPGTRLGLVLPKKCARRAVTRSLIKHQARQLWAQHTLPVGDWVLRLHAGWPKEGFPSAASLALKQAVRQELEALLAAGIARLSAAPAAAKGLTR